jgi:hypothetical protein
MTTGSYQDKDGDGKVAWYPGTDNPKEKPPAGQDKGSVESLDADKPTTESQAAASSGPIVLDEPYSSISSSGEAKAEFDTAFNVMFGTAAPKGLISAFTKELQNLQASRSTARVGTNKNIIIQGVSPQERQDILNKYLKSYASEQISLAQSGDKNALAALKRGNFGVTLTTMQKAYADNGLPVNQQSLFNVATEATLNPDKLQANLNLINLQAKTYFPALAEKIDKGYTVKQLLSPYIQTRANILEEDPDSIDIKNLQSVAKDPKNLMNLYDYEISLRQDPKWRFTKNAQDSISSVATGIAKMFGLVG